MKNVLIGIVVLGAGIFLLYKATRLHAELRKRPEKNPRDDAMSEPEAPMMFVEYVTGAILSSIGLILALVALW